MTGNVIGKESTAGLSRTVILTNWDYILSKHSKYKKCYNSKHKRPTDVSDKLL